MHISEATNVTKCDVIPVNDKGFASLLITQWLKL
jgi:hypothetical protein